MTDPALGERPFSAQTRQENLSRLPGEMFDLLVIGGGITGVAIARDAAMRGLRVALVEKDDFASGTSSRSTRLIHGGIRYLEYGEFKLVFDACSERYVLRRVAPRLVRPLPFLYPIYSGQRPSPFKLRAGLILYDAMSLFRNTQNHRWLSPQEVERREPLVAGRGLVGIGRYYDAQVNDARLTLLTAKDAHRRGALLVNHARVVGLLHAQGRVAGAQVVDESSGRQFEVQARVVVNATGIWVDEINRLERPEQPALVRPTKGIHLLIPRQRLDSRHAVIFSSPRDHRHMFLIPWGDFALVGTTDTDYQGGLDDPAADWSDVDYLLEALRHIFPGAQVQAEDVVSTFAGLRPLVAAPGNPSAVSRAHVILESESGLLTITGGKLTTHRLMAAELTDRVEKRLAETLGWHALLDCRTREPLEDGQLGRMRVAAVDEAVAHHLLEAYGSDAVWPLAYAEENPLLAEPIAPGLPYLLAEPLYAVQHEMALTLNDVLMRRSHVIYEAADGGLARASAVAAVIAPRLGWDEAEQARQVLEYSRQVALTCAWKEKRIG